LILQNVNEWWKPLKFDAHDQTSGESSIHHNSHPSQLPVPVGAAQGLPGDGTNGH
jgi:hypothetical protein